MNQNKIYDGSDETQDSNSQDHKKSGDKKKQPVLKTYNGSPGWLNYGKESGTPYINQNLELGNVNLFFNNDLDATNRLIKALKQHKEQLKKGENQ